MKFRNLKNYFLNIMVNLKFVATNLVLAGSTCIVLKINR